MKSEYASSAAAQSVEQPAIDYAHNVLEEARTLVARVEDLADRLCGHVPTPKCATADNLAPSGLLPSLRDHAMEIRSRLADGAEALDRINRAL